MQNKLNFQEITDMPANQSVPAKPLIIENKVYLGACDKYFYALSLTDGSIIWSYLTEGIIMSPAIMHGGVLYFSAGNHLYALSKEGEFLWKFRTGGIILGSAAINNNVLYFGSCDKYLYALSLKTKEILWKFRTGAEIVSDPLIENNRIYFGSQDYYVYCLDLKGKCLWKFRANSAIMTGAIAATEEHIFFASADQNIYALDKKDGTLKWGFRTGDMIFNNPLILDSWVCIGSRDRYFYVLDQKTGTLQWKFRGNDEIDWLPEYYNNMIILSSDKVYALDKKGNTVWSFPMPPFYIACEITAKNNIVVFGAADGYIRGISAKDGTLIWKLKTKSEAVPHFGQLMPSPNWDPNLFDKYEKFDHLERLNELENFNPYTFTTKDIEPQNQKKYFAGEEILNIYELANNPVSYADKATTDAKRKRKEIEDILLGRKDDAKRYG